MADYTARVSLNTKILDFVQLGGPECTVGGTVFEMWLGALLVYQGHLPKLREFGVGVCYITYAPSEFFVLQSTEKSTVLMGS